jgi:hypothetical protein
MALQEGYTVPDTHVFAIIHFAVAGLPERRLLRPLCGKL